jgi:hypothetical protein
LDPSKTLLMQHFYWHIVEECSKTWPSLSPPREVDHNSQTARSCVCLEETWRLHHQFQEIILSWVQWIFSVTPHTRWSLPCVSATVERCFHQLQKLQRLCSFPSPLRTE